MNLTDQQRDMSSRALRLTGVLFSGFVITLLAIEFNFLFLFGETPNPGHIDNPNMNLASEIWSADSVLIGKFYIQNRSPVTFDEVNPTLYQALIATEDIRFYDHFGVDPKSALAVVYYAMRGDRRGGSTITQQLAKNLFNTRDLATMGLLSKVPLSRTVVYKLKEWITSFRLEARFEKDDILVLYLNTVDFGSNAYGIKVAARTYFNTTPDSLKIEESAVLVGLLKAPTFYNPIRNPGNSVSRRNVVLSQMVKYGMLSSMEGDSLINLPLVTRFSSQSHEEGLATWFRSYLLSELREWARENGYNLFTDGLQIHTTINARMQAHAELAVRERMRTLQQTFSQHWGNRNPWIDDSGNEIESYSVNAIKRLEVYRSALRLYNDNPDSADVWIRKKKPMQVYSAAGMKDTLMSSLDSLEHFRKFLHAGLVAMDPFDGSLKAWVGGTDYKFFKFDHVALAKRQPGSTFKPIVYTAAFENGMGPCDVRYDYPITIQTPTGPWTPKNSSGYYSGVSYTLRRALSKSVNTIAVGLTQELGPNKVIEMAHQLGITSTLDEVYSVGLGTSDVSLLEMATAYAPMVNGGFRVKPRSINRIEDRDGMVIRVDEPDTQRVISYETAFLMTQMLKGGLEDPGGTSRGLYAFDLFRGNEIGGKTGTTSNYSDGWYVAVTPQIVAASWVGGEERVIRFRGNQGEGAKTALPIVGQFLQNSYRDPNTGLKRMRFPDPEVPISKRWRCPVEPDVLEPTESDNLIKIDRSIRGILDNIRRRLLN
jgi:penicillin-binding protein 1A